MRTGDVIGDWKLIREIGRDPRGVWFESETSRGRRGRLLWIEARWLSDEGARRRWSEEMARAASLQSPHILHVMESGKERDGMYAVLPPEEGRSLIREMEEKGALSEDQAWQLAMNLASVLDHAAQSGISHGHLRAADVRHAPSGLWALEGWGFSGVRPLIASANDPSPALRELLSDQPEYAAPDFFRPGVVDLFSADQYALGALLYHAVTGRPPFAGLPAEQVFAKHQFGMIDDPMDAAKNLSAGFSMVIERMMARKPQDRFRNFSEVKAAVSGVRSGVKNPGGDLPVGRSVIRRSSRRGASASGTAAVFGAAPDIPTPKPGRRITVATPAVADSPQEKHRRLRRDDFGWRVSVLISSILVVLTGLWWVFGGTSGLPAFPFRKAPPDRAVPPRTQPLRVDASGNPLPGEGNPPSSGTARFEPGTPAEPAPPPSVTDGTRPAPPESSAPGATGSRRPSAFQEGARKFNEANALFRQYRDRRAYVPGLERVPGLAESAARSFDACLSRALPAEQTELKRNIDQCYKLAMAARQALLMTDGPDETSGESRPHPPRRTPATTAPDPSLPEMRLAPGWSMTPVARDVLGNDLRQLLAGRGQPQAILRPAGRIQLAEGVRYLDEAGAVERALGLSGPAREIAVETSVYPARSFSLVEYNLAEASDFNRIGLLVDTARRVAAIQYSDDQPRNTTWLPPSLAADRWKIYDFITGEQKPANDLRIAHRVRVQQGGWVRIDTELVSPDGARSMARRSLILPQPMTDLLLLQLQR
jgi:hypothetical protein